MKDKFPQIGSNMIRLLFSRSSDIIIPTNNFVSHVLRFSTIFKILQKATELLNEGIGI